MSVNADDLPNDVRAKLGLPPRGRKRPRPSKAGLGEGRRLESAVPTRCVPCGVTFLSYREAEKHLDAEHGSGRLETVDVAPPS